MTTRVVLTDRDYAALPNDGRRYEMVVEILSPSTIETDRRTKLQLYARHGIPSYWIMDPAARTVEADTLQSGAYELSVRVGGDEALRAEPLPDLQIPIASLWP